jgi:hypothetical protein
LYTVAKQKQLQSQIIKCLVYKLSLEDRIFENKPNNAISILETEIGTSTNEAAKSILYNLLVIDIYNISMPIVGSFTIVAKQSTS